MFYDHKTYSIGAIVQFDINNYIYNTHSEKHMLLSLDYYTQAWPKGESAKTPLPSKKLANPLPIRRAKLGGKFLAFLRNFSDKCREFSVIFPYFSGLIMIKSSSEPALRAGSERGGGGGYFKIFLGGGFENFQF